MILSAMLFFLGVVVGIILDTVFRGLLWRRYGTVWYKCGCKAMGTKLPQLCPQHGSEIESMDKRAEKFQNK